jgi:microcystin-dependent protein
MANNYVGEIRIFAGNFPPVGWMFCDGTPLPISENDVLFNLIGTTYGGDGQNTFNLPDLRGRLPLHMGTGSFGTTYQIGEAAGVEQVTLTANQIPSHTHPMTGTTNAASSNSPAGNVGARVNAASVFPYGTDFPAQQLSPQAVGATGGSQPHTNFQPYLCLNFIISLFGIYPSP